MSTHVPLISSGVAGPLGVLHLPRLWLKVSLEARGKLANGYPGIRKCALVPDEENPRNREDSFLRCRKVPTGRVCVRYSVFRRKWREKRLQCAACDMTRR